MKMVIRCSFVKKHSLFLFYMRVFALGLLRSISIGLLHSFTHVRPIIGGFTYLIYFGSVSVAIG